MEFRTAYGPKIKVELVCAEKSRTKQSMKQECDVNFIVQQFAKTGYLPHYEKYQGEYGVFEDIDYHTAMNQVIEAQDAFMELPASVRKTFGNDPSLFMEFATNPENRQALADMGLAPPITKEVKYQGTPDPDPAPITPDDGSQA